MVVGRRTGRSFQLVGSAYPAVRPGQDFPAAVEVDAVFESPEWSVARALRVLRLLGEVGSILSQTRQVRRAVFGGILAGKDARIGSVWWLVRSLGSRMIDDIPPENQEVLGIEREAHIRGGVRGEEHLQPCVGVDAPLEFRDESRLVTESQPLRPPLERGRPG